MCVSYRDNKVDEEGDPAGLIQTETTDITKFLAVSNPDREKITETDRQGDV